MVTDLLIMSTPLSPTSYTSSRDPSITDYPVHSRSSTNTTQSSLQDPRNNLPTFERRGSASSGVQAQSTSVGPIPTASKNGQGRNALTMNGVDGGRGQGRKTVMTDHEDEAVKFVLLAEFDIDQGATLAYQYPFPTGTDEQ